MTVILKLFKTAVRVIQYKDRAKLQLPSRGGLGQALAAKVCGLLCEAQGPALSTT